MANSNGFSLIGTLVAVLLLTSAAVAITRLMAQTETVGRLSRDTFVAANLGREGLELVRALRDTNWFLRRSDNRHWTKGICSDLQTDEDFAGERTFTIDSPTVRNLDPVGPDDASELSIGSTGEWTHDASGDPTRYARQLTVDCSDKDVSILVTSKITWADQRGDQEWVVQERLYDWLP